MPTKEKFKTPPMTQEAVWDYLKTHSDLAEDPGEPHKDGTREYETAIVTLIDELPWEADTVYNSMMPLIKDEEKEPHVAYAAFYALCTYYRRNGLVLEYEKMITMASPEFRNKVSFAFLQLMCQKMRNATDWTLLDKADRLCQPDVMGYNYGVAHCFAEYVADACEKAPQWAEYFIEKYMDKALERVNYAINKKEDYPKFYVTKGRLWNILAMHGDVKQREIFYTRAQNDIDKAITTEKDKGKQIDYRLRRLQMQSEYYEKLLSNTINSQREEQDNTIKMQEEMLDQKIKDNNVKNLEFLSFFSAVIGLLIAGTQIMLGMEFAEGAILLMVLTGCLITAFGTIGFVLHGTKERLVINSIVVAVGIVLTVCALLYGGNCFAKDCGIIPWPAIWWMLLC